LGLLWKILSVGSFIWFRYKKNKLIEPTKGRGKSQLNSCDKTNLTPRSSLKEILEQIPYQVISLINSKLHRDIFTLTLINSKSELHWFCKQIIASDEQSQIQSLKDKSLTAWIKWRV
jgi:hypothetical protein